MDIDVYKPERWLDDALFRPEVRAAYAALLDQGWTDAVRHLHPNERIYTFWDYFRNAYARNAGLRIDHLLLNPALAPRLAAAGVDRHVRGWEKSSDHAPAWIEVLPEAPKKSPRAPRKKRSSITRPSRLNRAQSSSRGGGGILSLVLSCKRSRCTRGLRCGRARICSG
jgi:exodeoxyribonuclease-3